MLLGESLGQIGISLIFILILILKPTGLFGKGLMTMRNATLLYCAIGFAALALAPLGISSKFYLDILTLIFFTAYIGQSWNILGGYAGQFSFGGVMFFGTGAYASSILVNSFGVPAIIGVVVAIIAGAVLALCVGYLSFRSGLRGSYFALITLAFAELLRVIANSLEITGGGVGLFLTYAPGLQNLQFKTPVGFYYFALILLAISIAIAIWLEIRDLAPSLLRSARMRTRRRRSGSIRCAANARPS